MLFGITKLGEDGGPGFPARRLSKAQDVFCDRTGSEWWISWWYELATIGRVAKPFNPLLGETYEYARPDRGFRFFIEQVSHHPPVGAAYAESATWEYYGESAVKSKFYGKSFDFNPLGTWFLNLRPKTGVVERYTWKKVTSSVVGIISGSPTVDNYGPMVVKNWTTGEVCTLDFKPRGWRCSIFMDWVIARWRSSRDRISARTRKCAGTRSSAARKNWDC